MLNKSRVNQNSCSGGFQVVVVVLIDIKISKTSDNFCVFKEQTTTMFLSFFELIITIVIKTATKLEEKSNQNNIVFLENGIREANKCYLKFNKSSHYTIIIINCYLYL